MEEEKAWEVMGLATDTLPTLTMLDRTGELRAALVTMPGGSLGLHLLDAEGNVVHKAP